MTEKEVQLLGLQKEYIGEYECDESYYYALDVVNGLTFITPASEELKTEDWFVEIFNTDPTIRFNKFEEVQGLINQLTSAIVKK